MKKLYCIILAVALLLSVAVFAFAEGFDFSDFSDEELLQLRQEADIELAKRGAGVVIPAGIYHVGVDFDPGSYTLTLAAEMEETGYYLLDEKGKCIEAYNLNPYEPFRVFMELNQTLELEGPCLIAPNSKIEF